MTRRFTLAVVASLLALAPANAAGITGKYVEARTCDVWTGPCFANADYNLGGKNAVMAWQIDKGSLDGVSLDGLGVVAVLSANNTLGMTQVAPARTLILVDNKATSAQRQALVRFAQRQGGRLLQNVVGVQSAPIHLTMCECKGGTCAELQAGGAMIKTRCIDGHKDSHCGNETAFHPPLAGGLDVRPAAAVEHTFLGTGLDQTWRDFERRGAYVGSFAAR